MDDNESMVGKSGVNDTIKDAEPPQHTPTTGHGQATIPRGPLQSGPDSAQLATGMFVEMARISTAPEGGSSPSKPPAASNATAFGAPLESALQSTPGMPAPKLPATIAQTSFAAPAGAIAKTVTDIPQGMPSSPSIAPASPPSRKKKDEGIPVLPIALGVGALVAGIGLFAIVWSGTNLTKKEDSPTMAVPTGNAESSLNAWIRVEGAPGKVIGVNDNDVAPSVRGFRPAHQVLAASAPFEIQQHEVTWAELDPWLEKNPTHSFPRATTGLTSADARKSLPAYGVPWTTALEYCRSMRGTLPTEEQWELAARGSTMKKFPWGSAAPDWSKVHAFKGEMAGPAKVMSNEQDRTEGPADKAIFDLAGNVQEWTFSVWRDDAPDQDESWAQAQGTTAYAVRGFPLHRDAPGRSDELSIAYRDWICGAGDCSPLSAGASPKERARTPKLELWAGADSTQPEALQWRRVIEKRDVMAAMTRCFSGPTSTTLAIKATKGVFCKRPEQVPSDSSCDGVPVLSGAVARASGGLSEMALKCVNYALHEASAANVASLLPEAQLSYALYVTTDPKEALRHVGFRCVRDAVKP